VDVGDNDPIYADGLTEVGKRRTKADPSDPLPQRTWAIRHLRKGDKLVIYDEATLGTSDDDILAQAAAIGLRGAAILVSSTRQEYRWHPEAAAMAAFAARGDKTLKREHTANARRRKDLGFKVGRTAKITDPAIKARALALWGDTQVPNQQAVADALLAEFGLKVSPRTIRNALDGLGREDAVNGRAVKPKKKGRAK